MKRRSAANQTAKPFCSNCSTQRARSSGAQSNVARQSTKAWPVSATGVTRIVAT